MRLLVDLFPDSVDRIKHAERGQIGALTKVGERRDGLGSAAAREEPARRVRQRGHERANEGCDERRDHPDVRHGEAIKVLTQDGADPGEGIQQHS